MMRKLAQGWILIGNNLKQGIVILTKFLMQDLMLQQVLLEYIWFGHSNQDLAIPIRNLMMENQWRSCCAGPIAGTAKTEGT